MISKSRLLTGFGKEPFLFLFVLKEKDIYEKDSLFFIISLHAVLGFVVRRVGACGK